MRRSRAAPEGHRTRQTEPSIGRRAGDKTPFGLDRGSRDYRSENEETPWFQGVLQWRDRDSNSGHHDFQAWTEIALTRLKVLQFWGFAWGKSGEDKSAICILFSRTQHRNPPRCLNTCTDAPYPAVARRKFHGRTRRSPPARSTMLDAARSSSPTDGLGSRPRDGTGTSRKRGAPQAVGLQCRCPRPSATLRRSGRRDSGR
jgi:hypothetical protein